MSEIDSNALHPVDITRKQRYIYCISGFLNIYLSGRENRHTVQHRRRIKTEEKAKIIAAVWGTEWIQFLAALAILHYTI